MFIGNHELLHAKSQTLPLEQGQPMSSSDDYAIRVGLLRNSEREVQLVQSTTSNDNVPVFLLYWMCSCVLRASFNGDYVVVNDNARSDLRATLRPALASCMLRATVNPGLRS